MQQILSTLTLEHIYKECVLSTSRSGGPGGQHVNKVETKVTLRWDIKNTEILSAEHKTRLLEKLKNKINSEGELVINEQSARNQKSNKEKIFKKLHNLLQEALRVDKKRKATKPSKESVIKNKKAKQKRSEVKSMRQKPRLDY